MTKILSKKEKNSSLEPKKIKNNFQIRLHSAIILVILMLIYISVPIIHTELMRHETKNSSMDIVNVLGIISVAITAILVGFSVYEISKAVGIKEWWAILVLICMAVLIFVWPIGNAHNLKEQIYFYSYWNKSAFYGMASWWAILLLIFAAFSIFMIISKLSKESSLKNGLLVFGIGMLIIFAMKGFTTISLSMSSSEYNNRSDILVPTYSFTSIIWIWCTIIFTDTFAYLGGSKFGKNKLAPKISENKTWEGAIIGTTVAVAIGIVFAVTLFYVKSTQEYSPFFGIFQWMVNGSETWMPGFLLAILTLLISILGQLGDLLFSAIKRSLGIKDYSNLIPGHGGILDRLDSFYFVFFVIYILTLFF